VVTSTSAVWVAPSALHVVAADDEAEQLRAGHEEPEVDRFPHCSPDDATVRQGAVLSD
jgi:hypothetical protein